MTLALLSRPRIRRLAILDPVATRLAAEPCSLTEEELLKRLWADGEDVRLREDPRFRQTPWGRWILSERWLANDAAYDSLRLGATDRPVDEVLKELAATVKRTCVLCPNDPRLVVRNDRVRLSAKELEAEPLLEEPTDVEKYRTHLPVHTLQAAAAALPAGEWGPRAQEEVVETHAWMRVTLPQRRLNERMFVARVVGHSMDDGRTGLCDQGLAVFEFGAASLDRQPIVLVQGSFSDPETGSYAVKRYVAETDAAGETTRVRLVSANPDKTHFPDIEVRPEQADAVRVVAGFIAPLSADDYPRQPRRRTTSSRRDLDSAETQRLHQEKLTTALATFFSLEPARASAEEPSGDWSCRYELAACDPRALALVSEPLRGLPSAVKWVTLNVGTEQRRLVASNLRGQRWREPVPPTHSEGRWAAVDFEEDLEEEMAALRTPAFPADTATIFALQSDGTARRLEGRSLSPGGRYRLLVPPSLESLPLSDATAWNGWRTWDVVVPASVPPDLRDLLGRLGLSLGAASYAVSWITCAPRTYGVGRRGETYPCFHPADAPTLHITGPATLLPGDLRVFLQGPAKVETVALPPGAEWYLGLDGLPEGDYALDLVPTRTRFEPSRLFFAVRQALPRLPSADIELVLDGTPTALGGATKPLDFSQLARLDLRTPPLWPVAALWRGSTAHRFATLHGSADGVVDGAPLLDVLGRLGAQERVGTLAVDFGDLGACLLRHKRDLTPQLLRERLQALLNERAEALAQVSGQFDLLRSIWLEPVLGLLGYRLQAWPSETSLPPGFGVARLETTLPAGDRVESRTVGVLLTTPSGSAFGGTGENTPRAIGMRLCAQSGLRYALVTDGLRWSRLDADTGRMTAATNLQTAAGWSDEDAEGFLFLFAAESCL